MPQPRRVEELTAELIAFYTAAWLRIEGEQARILATWPAERRSRRLAELRALQRLVDQLMDTADEQALRFTEDNLPQAYLLGAAAAGVGVPDQWSRPDLDAIGVLANDTYSDLLSATKFVRDSTKSLIRTLSREHIADKLIIGQTAEQAARELAQSMAGRGIAAVVYKNGARHGLADYASVVTRTKTAEAYSRATLNQLERAGIGYAECFDNPKCGMDGHDDPHKPNGQVFTIRVAQSAVISHPRCVRAWGGRPDVTSEREARAARGSATAEQNADQAAVAVSRQEAAIARSMQRRRGTFTDAGTRVPAPAHANVLSRRQATLAKRTQAAAARAVATPAQVAQRLVGAAQAAEPELTRLTTNIAAQHGGTPAGLDFRLKTEESLARKIAGDVEQSGLSADEVGAKMFDVNRYTTVFPEGRYAASTQAALDELRGAGYQLNVKNYWNNTTNPYQGVNVQVTSPGGLQWELQFHTPRSLDVKEGELHRIYELRRVETDQALLDRYDAEAFDVAAQIQIPNGIDTVR